MKVSRDEFVKSAVEASTLGFKKISEGLSEEEESRLIDLEYIMDQHIHPKQEKSIWDRIMSLFV